MAPTYGDVVRDAAARLSKVSESPRLDAELLLAHAVGLSRADLLARLRESGRLGGFPKFMDRRLAHEPVAYILGYREFYSLDFLVRRPVLIPRPETEHLVETALKFAEEAARPLRILDLCTGSGCVAITLAAYLTQCDVTAADISPDAVALTRENAKHVGSRVRVRQGDLFDALPKDEPAFDIITANPPYVEAGEWNTLPLDITKYEDKRALVAGADGLDLVRRIVAAAPDHLNPDGFIALEIGEKQHEAATAILNGARFVEVQCVEDLAGIKRIVTGRRSA